MTTNKFALSGLIACLGLTGLALSGTGCAGTRYERSTGAYLDDTAVGSRVKTALFRDPLVSGFDVNVDTFRGDVQLSGFVDTPEQKARAAEIARNITGVQMVNNNLQLKPAGTAVGTAGSSVERSSGTITERPAADVTTPSGSAPVHTPSASDEQWRPVPAPAPVPADAGGDRPLDLDSSAPALDFDPSAPAQANASDPSSPINSQSLNSASMVPQNLEIEASDGKATIRGNVSSEAEKQNIERRVRDIPGIQNVENQIQVQSSPNQ